MDVTIDVSDEDVEIGVAEDGFRFQVYIAGLVLTLNHEQMTDLYQQLRMWNEDVDATVTKA